MADEVDKYPLHTEMKRRLVEQQATQNVLDWIAEQGYEICEDRWKDKPTADADYQPIRLREGKLVGAIMGVDYDAFMAEKDAMYEEMVAGG